jgi:6-phosphofructokinase 1
MGRYCGYLALMSGLATGAERVYLHERGITLHDLQADLASLITGFTGGKRLGLLIRNEKANDVYSTGFITSLFEEEGGDLFEVRQAILGHLQQGGNPTPFDRILATRLVACGIDYHIEYHDLFDLPRLTDLTYGRPRQQWWMDLAPIASILAQPGPSAAMPAGAS